MTDQEPDPHFLPPVPPQMEVDEFRHAAGRGDTAAVAAFLDKYPAAIDRMSVYGDTALVCAAVNGHKKVVELLLQRGAIADLPDSGGWTPFMWARLGYKDIAEILWEKTASAAAKECRAATQAAGEAKKSFLPSDTDTALYISAAARGDIGAVGKFLDQQPALINQVRDGSTALCMAAFKGKRAVVELLLDRGAQIDMRNSAGNTPLMCAAGEGHAEIVELLWKKGAAREARNYKNHTPLMWAALAGQTDVVRFFLEQGVPRDAVDNCGQTALALAKLNSRAQTAELLTRWPEILRQREEQKRARELAEALERQKTEITNARLEKIKEQRKPQSPFRKDAP